jgi:hypothetical protein
MLIFIYFFLYLEADLLDTSLVDTSLVDPSLATMNMTDNFRYWEEVWTFWIEASFTANRSFGPGFLFCRNLCLALLIIVTFFRSTLFFGASCHPFSFLSFTRILCPWALYLSI